MSKFAKGTLAARWRRNHDGCGPDVVFYYPNKPDGHMLHSFFSYANIGAPDDPKYLLKELEKRGYDLSTLEFTIRKKRT